MNISLQNIDKVSALLSVRLEKADYEEKVNKSLKELRRKLQMPGFRQGMVPVNIVKKLYGKSVLAEEVNKLLSDSVNSYIRDNKVDMLGEPLPNEKQQQIDFDAMESFEFLFDIALAPEFSVNLSTDDKVDYYTIDVTDEMVDKQTELYTRRNGKFESVDVYADGDMMKGMLSELDAEGNVKEGGIQVEDAMLMPSYMKNDGQKALFANAKVGDVLVFNPATAWDGNSAELASLLKIEKKKAAEVKADFSFQVKEISRFMPGELDQEIFDEVFGKDVVKTEEEFRAKVKESIAARFASDSDYKFIQDMRDMLLKKVGQLDFSESLLKRLMKANNPGKDDSFVDEHYAKNLESLTWSLIEEKLMAANGIRVEQSDLTDMAKETARARFAQYGMLSVPDDIVDSLVKDMLKEKKEVDEMAARVIEKKLSAALKQQVTLENKNISREDFNKMFE